MRSSHKCQAAGCTTWKARVYGIYPLETINVFWQSIPVSAKFRWLLFQQVLTCNVTRTETHENYSLASFYYTSGDKWFDLKECWKSCCVAWRQIDLFCLSGVFSHRCGMAVLAQDQEKPHLHPATSSVPPATQEHCALSAQQNIKPLAEMQQSVYNQRPLLLFPHGIWHNFTLEKKNSSTTVIWPKIGSMHE